MFHLFSRGDASERTIEFIVGNYPQFANPLPQKNTRSPWPYNKMKVGECIWMTVAETQRTSRVAAIDSALIINRAYKKILGGDMFYIYSSPERLEITRIR